MAPSDDSVKAMHASGKMVVGALFALGLALASIAYFGGPVVRLKPATVVLRPLVAVLPFDNLGGDDELELVAADVTRAVIERLMTNPELRVMPHQATLAYRDLEGGAGGIAEALGADYVLAGSVERETSGLRLQAYFVKPGERPRIWADEFRYPLSERDSIPADIARVVGEALTGSEARPTDRPDSP